MFKFRLLSDSSGVFVRLKLWAFRKLLGICFSEYFHPKMQNLGLGLLILEEK